jgi:hypothetical protein
VQAPDSRTPHHSNCGRHTVDNSSQLCATVCHYLPNSMQSQANSVDQEWRTTMDVCSMAKQSSGPQFVDSAVPDKTQHISIQDCRTLLIFGCVDHLIHTLQTRSLGMWNCLWKILSNLWSFENLSHFHLIEKKQEFRVQYHQKLENFSEQAPIARNTQILTKYFLNHSTFPTSLSKIHNNFLTMFNHLLIMFNNILHLLCLRRQGTLISISLG